MGRSYFERYSPDPHPEPVSVLPLRFALEQSVRLESLEARFEREAYAVMATEEDEAKRELSVETASKQVEAALHAANNQNHGGEEAVLRMAAASAMLDALGLARDYLEGISTNNARVWKILDTIAFVQALARGEAAKMSDDKG